MQLAVSLPDDVLDALAAAVAERLEPDDGFMDADRAAAYLGLSRKAIYGLVQRRTVPFHRPAGRLLFDRRELRSWAIGSAGHLRVATVSDQSQRPDVHSAGAAYTARGASTEEVGS